MSVHPDPNTRPTGSHDPARTLLPQSGERSLPLSAAFDRGLAAAAELGLTAQLTPILDADPGAWICALSRDGIEADHGLGMGKGDPAAARAGALFEALEHHLSSPAALRPDQLTPRSAHAIAAGPLAADPVIAMLTDGADAPVACLTTESLRTGETAHLPVFLTMPEYLEGPGAALRSTLGDTFDYAAVGRYASNNGWATGSDPVEATVHALNELVERDALSLLLIDAFLGRARAPLRVLDPATLPADLGRLHDSAQHLLGRPVHLIDMTTDLAVPAYIAFSPPAPGEPARIRGCGASLSRGYAIRRALTEIVQLHLGSTPANPFHTRREAATHDRTTPYPALHRCKLADFSPLLPGARALAFAEPEVPADPSGHQDRLVELLTERGHPIFVRHHHTSADLAVVHAR